MNPTWEGDRSVNSDIRRSAPAVPSHVGQLTNAAIYDLRESFLTAPASTDPSSLRPVIARSWQRSLACNVNTSLSFWPSGDPRADEQLLLAAEPVLTELEGLCVDVGGIGRADRRRWDAGRLSR